MAHKLNAIARDQADKGGIDRIMIFDHGLPGGQEFGAAYLKPDDAAWKVIISTIKPQGSIVFTGRWVAAQTDDIVTGDTIDGKAYVDSCYLAVRSGL